jgi:glycerol-1-phosphate dehydrogenase [NAD(P)+]
MDGYASVGAALILNEMKITLNARVPYAIVAEGEILRTSPIDMIRAGYGDIIGKYSCLNDWKLAKLLKNEYFCDYVWQTVLDTVKKTEKNAAALLERDADAVSALTEALVTVGILMSYVGNSRPASGSEHHLSHYFEITGLLHKRDYYPHGIDVLYSAAVTAKLRESLLKREPPFSPFAEAPEEREDAIRKTYTTAADAILELQEKVGLYQTLDTSLFADSWDEIKEILSESPSYAQMCAYLDAIGLNIDEFHAFYGKDVIRDCVRYAKDLKDRYTVLWLCYALSINYNEI